MILLFFSECYKQINSNYDNVLERLGSEDMVKMFEKHATETD